MKTAFGIVAALLASTSAALAADKQRSGEEIVKQVCSECHATGKHGAPKFNDKAAWVPRLKNGLEATVSSAIRGHGNMPARGGMASLTDAELRSAIVYMFNTQGAPTPPAATPAAGPNQKVVDGLEIFLGVKAIRDGVQHVNVTVRDQKTQKPVEDAQVEASVTNPVMGTETRKLEKTSDKTGSYHADFRMSGKESHTITVKIKRAAQGRATEAKFDYKG
jgi:cytochrome c5